MSNVDCRAIQFWQITLLVCLTGTSRGAEIDFNRDVRPILSDHCFQCHGPDAQQRASEFRLDTKSGAFMDLGDQRAIVPGDAKSSQLLQRIISDDPDAHMPPAEFGRQLSADQVEVLRKWINEGAAWQQHWSFIAPTLPVVPTVSSPSWCTNAIDHFVLAKLDQHGLQPSPRANRRKLIRRATLDLTGLPPKPAEVAAFENDPSPRAWQRVVDRLLQSPRYGERMAIDWLDAARYADTSGYQNDGPRDMYRWRDWVIDAYNGNMPFDRFTIEQLAGDLLPAATLDQRIATGFNRNHRGNAEGGIIAEEYQVEYVVDRVDTTATVWLGLTMGCARCHDHKYDAVSQQDFYRVFAYFNNIPEYGRAIKEGNSPPYVKAPTATQRQNLLDLERKLEVANQRVNRLHDELHRRQSAWESSFREAPNEEWMVRDALIDGVPRDPERFDGGEPLDVGDVANFGYFDKFSIGAFVKPAKPTGTIISRMVPVDQGAGYYVHLENGRLQINLVKRWLDDSIRVQSKHRLKLDQWQHITVTYDGSRLAGGIQAYLDGQPLELEVLHDFINQTFATEEPLRLGGGHAEFFGAIAGVQLHRRVLTADEISASAVSESIAEIVAIDPAQRTAGQARKLNLFYIDRYASEEVRNAYDDAVKAMRARDRYEESIPTVMVMQEREGPPQAFVLTRGQYDARAEKVSPGVPGILPPLPKDAPNNRLGLAKWIVSPDNPLTARVTVNRIWQMHFGTGLVKTTEDFGAQGDIPSHPKLLDWLAIRFMHSGWDLKWLHRTILTSTTYQQDSKLTDSLRRRDPDNRWLARGPRFRLPAEMVRDQSLFISGLMTERLGGPSVRPYQPDGLWKEIASTTNYEQSAGGELYRRSLYTYWKRTVAPPTMVTLDATSRESCIVKRSKTNTPLQALALMNEVTFVEAARVFASEVLRSNTSEDRAIASAFERATGRRPATAENRILSAALKKYRDAFERDPGAAKQLVSIGESPLADDADVTELAAWTMLASLIMNLDEVISKE